LDLGEQDGLKKEQQERKKRRRREIREQQLRKGAVMETVEDQSL
jgi:hypothetical protein